MELTPFVKANLSSSVKRYLYEYIRQEDKAGRTKLLPEEKLAHKMGVSRVTIRRALDELEREGLILRLHGRGTFINHEAIDIKVNLMPGEEFSRLIKKCGFEPTRRLVDFHVERADIQTAKALGIAGGTNIYYIKRLFFADGQPCIVSIDRFPVSLVQEEIQTEDIEGQSTFDFLRERVGCYIVRDKVDMEVLPAFAESGLDCSCMLVFHGINYDQDNRPIIYDTEYYDTNFVRFSFLRIKDVYGP